MNPNNFLKYCLGVSLVCGTLLFGTAALLYSAQPVIANTAPSTITENGRYMMSLQAAIDQSNVAYWYIIVWDTNTGRSKLYHGSSKKGYISAAHNDFNLPSSPL